LVALVEQHVSLLKSYDHLKKLHADMQKAEKVWRNADSRVVQLNKQLSELKKSKEYRASFCKYCGAHKSHWRRD
jgi:hypothetical protein